MSLSGLGLDGMGIVKISFAELGLNMLRTIEVFQVWSLWSMRWATFIGKWAAESTRGEGMKL